MNFDLLAEKLTDEWPASPDELEFLPLSLYLLEKYLHPRQPTDPVHGREQIQLLKALRNHYRNP
eukprot:1156449-Pelagomonas_calceolata.AAC.1